MTPEKTSRTLKDLGETEVHRRIARLLPSPPDTLELGPGDDAALFKPEKGKREILTTDSLLEGIHFPSDKIPWWDLGYKLVLVNASDVVAMGGKPTWFVAALAVPGETEWRSLKSLFQGMLEALELCGAYLVGGDVDEYSKVLLHGTMTGTLVLSRPLLVTEASPDEYIYVTGTLGDSAMGCRLAAGRYPETPADLAGHLIARHFRPPYRGGLLQEIEKVFRPTSLTDLSDGLEADIRKIAEKSGVGASIDLENLPVGVDLFLATEALGEDPRLIAASGGEDYELLFTSALSPEKAFQDLEGVPVTCIGRTTGKKGKIEWRLSGDRVEIAGGFRHFKG